MRTMLVPVAAVVVASFGCGRQSSSSDGPRNDVGPSYVDDVLVLPTEDLLVSTAHVYARINALDATTGLQSQVDKAFLVQEIPGGGTLDLHVTETSYDCLNVGATPEFQGAWTTSEPRPEDVNYRPLNELSLPVADAAPHVLHVRVTQARGCRALALRFTATLSTASTSSGGITQGGNGPIPVKPPLVADVGAWRPLSSRNAPPARSGHSAVWSGTEMIVFGGLATWTAGGLSNAAYAYDPVTDLWRPLAMTGAPAPRERHVAVWTGDRMIVFGGEGLEGGRPKLLGDGAVYRPSLDTWTPIATQGAPEPRSDAQAVWTGDRMIVFGGHCGRDEDVCPAAAYHPATDTWRPVNLGDAPRLGRAASLLWTGAGILTFEAQRDAEGGRYDVSNDRWSPMQRVGAPRSSYLPSDLDRRAPYTATLWDGKRLIATGHEDKNGSGWQTFAENVYRYDPATDLWDKIPAEGEVPTAATGLVGFADEGGVYLISTDQMWQWGFTYLDRRWHEFAEADTPSPRFGGTYLWTGREFIVWGGRTSDPFILLGDGAAFKPR